MYNTVVAVLPSEMQRRKHLTVGEVSVGAMLQQHRTYLELACGSGQVKRGGVIIITNINWRMPLQQQPAHIYAATPRRLMKWRGVVEVDDVCRRAPVDKHLAYLGVAVIGGEVKGCTLVLVFDVGGGTSVQEDTADVGAAVPGCHVKQGLVEAVTFNICATFGQESVDFISVVFHCGFNYLTFVFDVR